MCAVCEKQQETTVATGKEGAAIMKSERGRGQRTEELS